MGWLFSIFFVIYYFVSREPVTLLAASLFSISGAIGFIDVTLQKFYKMSETRNLAGNALFEFFKALGTKKEPENKEEQA